MSDRVTVVTVAYNSAAALSRMLPSLPPDAPVVVVDNNSHDNSVELAETAGATVIRNPDNRGFGVACNAGAAVATTDFILFLNPDSLVTGDALAAMVRAMDDHPDAAACNPRLSDEKGRPSLKRSSVLLPRRDWADRSWSEATKEVPVLTGAAFFVRRSAFEAVGGFDPEIFLYHEDDDLALRLRANGGRLLSVGSAIIQHIGGSSSARNAATARWKSFHLGRSRVYAMAKHARPYPFGASLFKAATKFLSPVILLSSRKRAQAIGFLRGVLSMRMAASRSTTQGFDVRDN